MRLAMTSPTPAAVLKLSTPIQASYSPPLSLRFTSTSGLPAFWIAAMPPGRASSGLMFMIRPSTPFASRSSMSELTLATSPLPSATNVRTLCARPSASSARTMAMKYGAFICKVTMPMRVSFCAAAGGATKASRLHRPATNAVQSFIAILLLLSGRTLTLSSFLSQPAARLG